MKLIFKIRAVLGILFVLSFFSSYSQGDDSQLRVYKNVVDDNGNYNVNPFTLSINPSSTVLVVIDFWDNVAPQRYIDNLINLIDLARSQEIPVIFFSHENPLNSQLELSEKDIILDGSKIVLENYLYNNGLDTKTILFAGFHTDACLTITRLNSVSRISWRSPQYQMIIVKDCTYTSYWSYLWAINMIETRFQTTTVASLARALTRNSQLEQETLPPFQSIDRGDTRYVSSVIEEYRKKYKNLTSTAGEGERDDDVLQFNGLNGLLTYDSTFGLAEDWEKTAVVILNPSTQISSKIWEKRARANINRNVSRVVGFARRKNMEVVYFTEDNLVDSVIRNESNEKKFAHPDSMFSYLSEKKIDRLIYVGNITSSSQHFTPLDAWRFTIFNGGFDVVFLEDCLITNELPETLEQQIFKKLFLETSMFYRPQYQVSTLSILYRNLPELSINEVLLDQDHDRLTIELFNSGGLPLDLSKFALAREPGIALKNISTSPKFLFPGNFYLMEFSYQELGFSDDDHGLVYLLNHYNDKVDSIRFSKSVVSWGRFPNGGHEIVSYDSPSLGASNYEVEQEKPLCSGEGPVKLKVSGANGLTYAWSVSGNVLSNSNEVMIESGGLYSVRLSYGDLSVTSTATVEMMMSPDSTWEMDGELNFCANERPVLRTKPVDDHSYYWIKDDVVAGTQPQYRVKESGYYSLMVKNKYGCTSQSEAVLLMQQEEGSCVEEKVTVSPNPGNGRVSLLINDEREITKIELYDAHGRKLFEDEHFSEKRFPNGASVYDIELGSDLESGLYLLVIKGSDLYHVERIIINN